jgi:hypothetical protein
LTKATEQISPPAPVQAVRFVRRCERCEEPADEVPGGLLFDCLFCPAILCRDCYFDHATFGCDADDAPDFDMFDFADE